MDGIDAPADRGFDRSDLHFQGQTNLLVGRTREQAVLRDDLTAASHGSGRLCLIGGEAGIGKTTLARALAPVAEERGFRSLAGSCYELTNVPPYGLWLDLFEACQRDRSLPPPPAAFAGGQLSPVTDQGALFADARRFFSDLTGDRPALILLEDLHWTDPASLDLLRHIGPHLRHWPVLLVVTYRSDELTPGRPFTQHLPALIRETDGRRIDLHRLDDDAVRRLVASRYQLAPEDENRLLIYLRQHAEGNPFFTIELLRALEENRLLQRDEGGWTLAVLEYVVVPPLLRQVIESRAARLGEEKRKALAIAAVIGHEVPLDHWAQVADLDDAALLDIVEQAMEAQLLDAERDGTRVRFVHALTREALYEGILPPRRRIWHRMVADALMTSDHADPDSVAFHLQEASDPRAAEWLIQAGERAQHAYAWLTASERFRAATSLLQDIDGQDGAHRGLTLRPSYLLRFSYPADAIGDLDMAERLAMDIGDAYMSAEIHNLRGLHLCYSDRFRSGLADMERGISAFERLPPTTRQVGQSIRDWLTDAFTGRGKDQAYDDQIVARVNAAEFDYRRSYHLWLLAAAGHLATAQAAGKRFIETFGTVADMPGGIRVASGFAHHGMASAFAGLGRPVEARRTWMLARKQLSEIDHHVLVAFMLLDELRDVALTSGADDPATRRQLAANAEAALGRAVGVLRPGVSPSLAWLRCLIFDGRWNEAAQMLDDLPPPGNTFLRRETTFARAVLAFHRGDPDTVWVQIRLLFPNGHATEPGDIIHQEGLFLQRLATRLCLDASDLPAAKAWLTAHDDWLAWSGSVLGRAEGQLAWGEYHHTAGDTSRARRHLDDALKLAKTPDQPLVSLGAHRLLGEIDGANSRVAEAEAHLVTALSLADACDVPFERALTLLALAELRMARGTPLIQEAMSILSRLGAAPALARANDLATRITGASGRESHPFGLTARELEVLRLVAEGRTNPEIAEALFISRETARTHVSHIYRKLDVGTRAEAVDRAHRHALLVTPSPR